jgi:cAMP phosphodiesterase
MADSVASMRTTPLQIWALPEVLEILSKHILNELIWPDFTKLPNPTEPFVTLHPLPANGPLELGDLRFTPLSAHHGQTYEFS